MSNVAAARIFLRNIGHTNVALHLQRDIYTSKTDTQKKISLQKNMILLTQPV